MGAADPDAGGWLLDEGAFAGAEHLDARYVEGYDTKSPTDWSDDLDDLRSLGIDRSSTVVDIGAGTGTFALAVRPHVRRVVAVDVSPAMVAELGRRGLEAVQAGFLSYEHAGDPADAVMTRNALHHLPDFWKAIALLRVAAMLRDGGVLLLHDLVFSFDPPDAESAIQEWIDAAPTDATRGWTAAALAEHMRTEHSTFTWLLEPMLERSDFVIRKRHVSRSGIYAAYVCTRQTRSRSS